MSRLLGPLIGGERAEFADEQLGIGDGKMSPGFFVGEFALVDKIELGLVGADEVKTSVLIKGENPIALGDEAPIFSEGLVRGPEFAAGFDFDGHETLALQEIVGDAIDDDRGTHVALGLVGPGLGERVGSFGAVDFEPDGFTPVRAGEEHVLVDDWSQDVHSPEGFDRLIPQDRAGFGIDTGDFLAGLNHELTFAGNGDEDRGRKGIAPHAAFVIQGTPDQLAGFLVEFDETGAGLDIDGVAIDQGRAHKAEFREWSPKFSNEIKTPTFLAICRIEGDEDISDAGDVERIAVARGSRADPVPVGFGEERDTDGPLPLGFPKLLAGRAVEGPYDLVLFIAGFRGEHLAAMEDGAGVAGSEFDSPRLFQMIGRERLGPGCTGDVAVAIGATPLMPVVGWGAGDAAEE